MSEPSLDKLRAEAVDARGLDPAAARLLTGTTVDEIERSADELARLIGERAETGEREQPGSDLFARAAADKERRRSDLLGALSGRPRQPEPVARDDQGRFVSSGFDGGSRTPPPSPPPSHEQTLSELFQTKAADVGRTL